MITTRRDFIKTVSAAIATTQVPAQPSSPDSLSLSPASQAVASATPPAKQRRKMICDQDNSGPFSSSLLATLMMLQSQAIDLLGITLVTGGSWMRQQMAFTLRLLEMTGRREVPVFPGAEFPMLNTKEEWLLRLQLFGGNRWEPSLGAFDACNGAPSEVKPLPAPYEHFASISPQQDHAARFIIQSVRENPHEVTLYSGGPLTNIALAIALAPELVPLVPEVIVTGTGFHTFSRTFNIAFDPEAARKVLRAPWPKLTIVPVDLADETFAGDALDSGRQMVGEVVDHAPKPIADIFKSHAVAVVRQKPTERLHRMHDEIAAAQVIDPTLFTSSEPMFVDICTTPGPRYGDSMFWRENWQELPAEAARAASAADRRVFVDPSQFYLGPPPSAGLAHVLAAVDSQRFKQRFVELMTRQR